MGRKGFAQARWGGGWRVLFGREFGELRRKSLFLGLVLAWLVPGGGHYYMGKKGKGVYYFSLVTLTFLLGVVLARFLCVNPDRFPYHYLGEVLNGGATLLVQTFTRDLKVERFNPFLDYGTLIVTVAGLLNVVVIVDFVESWAERR